MTTSRAEISPVSTLLLAAWLGAALLLSASVAPAAFAALPSRTLAGEVVGRVLPAVFWSGIAVGGGAFVLQRRRWRLDRGWAISLVLVILTCGIAQLAVSPAIEELRRAIGGPVDGLSPDDHRRILFGRLHLTSVALLGAAMVAAFSAIVLAVRSSRSPLQ